MFRSLVFSKRSFAADALGMGFLRMEEGGEGMDGSSLAAIELVTGRCFEF